MLSPVVINPAGTVQTVRLGEAVEQFTAWRGTDPNEARNARRRERYATDEEYREACKRDKMSRWGDRYANDPEFRAQYLAAQREHYANDPEFRAQRNAQQRAWRKRMRATDPEWRARQLVYQRAYRARKASERAVLVDQREKEVRAFIEWSVAQGLKKQCVKNRQAALRAYFRWKDGASP